MEIYQNDERIYNAVKSKIQGCTILVGFDGFIDRLTKPVRKRSHDYVTYFSTLNEFADFLTNKGEMSGSIELEELAVKRGGNNPITSYAMGKSGAVVYTIGAYGDTHIHPVFKGIDKYCKLYSFTAPGECWSYEFSENKIMNFINMRTSDFTYEKIVQAVHDMPFRELIRQCGLITLLNYSEQTGVLNIWNGILKNNRNELVGKKIFFDLSDCTRISSEFILEGFKLISEFNKISDVYLSLNDNEFLKLLKIYVSNSVTYANLQDAKQVEMYMLELKKAINVKCIILRTLKTFYALEENNSVSTQNIIEHDPQCLTGAGDNQNAGICIGLSCELTLEQSLRLGALYGSYYIRHGKIGTLDEVMSANSKGTKTAPTLFLKENLS